MVYISSTLLLMESSFSDQELKLMHESLMIHNESIVITYCDADNPDLSPYNAFDLGDAQNLRDTQCVMSRIHNVCKSENSLKVGYEMRFRLAKEF